MQRRRMSAIVGTSILPLMFVCVSIVGLIGMCGLLLGALRGVLVMLLADAAMRAGAAISARVLPPHGGRSPVR